VFNTAWSPTGGRRDSANEKNGRSWRYDFYTKSFTSSPSGVCFVKSNEGVTEHSKSERCEGNWKLLDGHPIWWLHRQGQCVDKLTGVCSEPSDDLLLRSTCWLSTVRAGVYAIPGLLLLTLFTGTGEWATPWAITCSRTRCWISISPCSHHCSSSCQTLPRPGGVAMGPGYTARWSTASCFTDTCSSGDEMCLLVICLNS